MTHKIIEQYLNEILAPQLTALGTPGTLVARIVVSVREQMVSCIYHWNDVPFRKTLLLIGEEEGTFYLPKANANIRNFVVVTLRNSALETIHADSYQGKRLTSDDIRAITAAAIEYFRNADFPAIAEQIGLLENDKYGTLAKKYPISWVALTQLANTTKQIVEYEPLPIIAKPNLKMLKPQNAVNGMYFAQQQSPIMQVTEDGYSLTVDYGLHHTLQAVIEHDVPFVGDSFKGISRNVEKLLAVMEYLLGNRRAYITANYLIANGHVERRLKPLKPAHDHKGMKRNWRNSTDLTKRHKMWLQAVVEDA